MQLLNTEEIFLLPAHVPRKLLLITMTLLFQLCNFTPSEFDINRGLEYFLFSNVLFYMLSSITAK